MSQRIIFGKFKFLLIFPSEPRNVDGLKHVYYPLSDDETQKGNYYLKL